MHSKRKYKKMIVNEITYSQNLKTVFKLLFLKLEFFYKTTIQLVYEVFETHVFKLY